MSQGVCLVDNLRSVAGGCCRRTGAGAPRVRAHLSLRVLLVQQLQPPALHFLVADALLREGVAVVMTRE